MPSAALRRRISFSSLGCGIVQAVAEHEPVELGLGQLERAALLDRVLGGDHQERRRQLERLVADRHAPLLHGLEQGALHLGRGSVDLVGQEQVGEDRPLVHAEIVGPLVEDLRADDVGGEQVDGELDAGEVEVDRLGQGRDQERLGQARHALKQQMPAGEQRDQEPLDDDVLADHDRPDSLAHGPDELERLGRDRTRTGFARLGFNNAHGCECSRWNTGHYNEYASRDLARIPSGSLRGIRPAPPTSQHPYSAIINERSESRKVHKDPAGSSAATLGCRSS